MLDELPTNLGRDGHGGVTKLKDVLYKVDGYTWKAQAGAKQIPDNLFKFF